MAVDREAGVERSAVVVSARRSGKRVEVPADQSILIALQLAGVAVATSCGNGVCGTCETRVLAGTPQHFDSVMPDADKDEIGVFYPCVSRATSAELVLDV